MRSGTNGHNGNKTYHQNTSVIYPPDGRPVSSTPEGVTARSAAHLRRGHVESRRRTQPGAQHPPEPAEIADAVLDDKTIVELVHDGRDRLRLLVWDGSQATIVPRFEYRGRAYLPVPLPAGEAKKFQLPTHAAEFGSTRELFNSMLAFVRQYSSIDLEKAKLVAHFALASWFPGCSSEALMMVITGAELESLQLLRVLHCLCRRALLLRAGSRASGVYAFPELRPTLLIDARDQSTSALRAMMIPGSEDFYVTRKGGLAQDCCAKAIYAGDLSDPVFRRRGLHMSITPSVGIPILDANTRLRVANELQPQLLQYRLVNHSAVKNSDFDLSRFTSTVREAGRGLGACIVGDPPLQTELVALLKVQDEIVGDDIACSVNAAIVDALVTIIHEGQLSLSVRDLTSLTNTILQDRGEELRFNARGPGIGHRLTSLGIPPRSRSGPGKKILLTQDLRRHAHQLARVHRSKMLGNSGNSCRVCAEMASPAAKRTRS